MAAKRTILLVLLCCRHTSTAFSQSYDELYRPDFHFTPRQNWMNDPNGLVYFDGEYHLFYQYNPFGAQWGNMTWGHAVSTDLVNWTQLPVAIPMVGNIMAFSGSAVSDTRTRTSSVFSVTFCESTSTFVQLRCANEPGTNRL